MTQSEELFARAQRSIPGGVNSPVRAFKAVGGTPLFIRKAEGCRLWDADGRSYIDYVGSWGPMILGHAYPPVVEAVQQAAARGTSFGAPCAAEVELAERVLRSMPAIERVRFVNSGTEATMSALRLARAFTGRRKILKFEGCYHGHADSLLVAAGSGVATLGIPGSPGVTEGTAADTLTAPFNDIGAVERIVETHGRELAAVIVEPVAGNMGCVAPHASYLQGLRRLTRDCGAVFILDEVMTGFRLARGGAQQVFGVKPDLTCLGKIIGGGLPCAAYGGRAEIMDHVAPLGPVYQAGTLSGNPLAMAAGIATLDAIARPGFFEELEAKGRLLEQELAPVLARHGHPARLSRVGSIFHLWFKRNAKAAPRDYEEIKGADAAAFGKFFWALLEQQVYLAPSAFEVGFISAAHQQQHIEATVTAMDRAFAAVG